MFEPLEHPLWFCEEITELFFFAHPSAWNDKKELDLYFENKSKK